MVSQKVYAAIDASMQLRYKTMKMAKAASKEYAELTAKVYLALGNVAGEDLSVQEAVIDGVLAKETKKKRNTRALQVQTRARNNKKQKPELPTDPDLPCVKHQKEWVESLKQNFHCVKFEGQAKKTVSSKMTAPEYLQLQEQAAKKGQEVILCGKSFRRAIGGGDDVKHDNAITKGLVSVFHLCVALYMGDYTQKASVFKIKKNKNVVYVAMPIGAMEMGLKYIRENAISLSDVHFVTNVTSLLKDVNQNPSANVATLFDDIGFVMTSNFALPALTL